MFPFYKLTGGENICRREKEKHFIRTLKPKLNTGFKVHCNIYDWRHEKRALKVKILHFEFLPQVALAIFSLSKNMKSVSLTCVLRFQ